MDQLQKEKENEINQVRQSAEELANHIEHLCQQHEETLLRAENDKQQALLIGKLNYKLFEDKNIKTYLLIYFV